MDYGETPAQKILRELKERLDLGKTIRPCGCCGVRTIAPATGAVKRPCGCTIAICYEDTDELNDAGEAKKCFKCLRHCPHRKRAAPTFEKLEDVIAHIRGRSSR